MEKRTVLTGHVNFATAYEVKDYPYRRKKTSKFYWIDTRKGIGDRVATVTRNPKNGILNRIEYGTYCTLMWLAIDEKGHVYGDGFRFNDGAKDPEGLDFICREIGVKQLSDIQQLNVRGKMANRFAYQVRKEKGRYPKELQPIYEQWGNSVLQHLMKCDFEQLLGWPGKPESLNVMDAGTRQAA